MKGTEGERPEDLEETGQKVIKRGTLVPDFSLLSFKSCEARAVGEAKTPWNHGIDDWWHDHGKLDNTFDLRHALGRESLIDIISEDEG